MSAPCIPSLGFTERGNFVNNIETKHITTNTIHVCDGAETDGIFSITNATEATTCDPLTGALQVTGGASIGGNLVVCGTITGTLSGGAGLAQYAQFHQLGAQPAPVPASQPLTFQTVIINSPTPIVSASGTVAGGLTVGTIFTLPSGIWEVSFGSHILDGASGLCIFTGATNASMAILNYTRTFASTATTFLTGTYLISTVGTPQVAICATAGANITESGPFPQAAVSFMKIA